MWIISTVTLGRYLLSYRPILKLQINLTLFFDICPSLWALTYNPGIWTLGAMELGLQVSKSDARSRICGTPFLDRWRSGHIEIPDAVDIILMQSSPQFAMFDVWPHYRAGFGRRMVQSKYVPDLVSCSTLHVYLITGDYCLDVPRFCVVEIDIASIAAAKRRRVITISPFITKSIKATSGAVGSSREPDLDFSTPRTLRRTGALRSATMPRLEGYCFGRFVVDGEEQTRCDRAAPSGSSPEV